MRHARHATVIAVALVVASCSSAGAPVDPTGRTQSAIAYGTADSTHTAVVSVLANAGGSSFDECSGTIVQVKSGDAYVLTAAHCCNATTPTVVVMSSDYSVGESAVVSGTAPTPPAYAVVSGSVWFDAQYNGTDHDFCMLKFPAPAGAAVIPVAQPGADGLALGVEVEHVGFGVTDTSTGNTGRRHETSPVDVSLTALVAQSSQGGASHVPGVCEGDSGGPGLLPAGAAQSAQTVVMTTSYGSTSSCAANTMSTCSRVTSETGPGGFITSYLSDAPSGTQAGSAQATCDACAQASQTGACKTPATACANDAACTTLSGCLGGCTTTSCESACEATAGTTAVAELNALNTCICDTACASQCAASCAGSGACGVMSSDATCNTCLDASCCSQGSACASDSACLSCLGMTTPAASCSSDAAYAGLTSCIDTTCGTACGAITASDAGKGGDASGGHDAGKGGDAAVTSDGSTGGNGTEGGTSDGDDGGGSPAADVGRSGGCSVAANPEPAAPNLAVVAALALALARRRRSASTAEPTSSAL